MTLRQTLTAFRKVALTMPQVEEYQPPPNPAKMTDSRAKGYVAEHGDESWEVDALEPSELVRLIEEHITDLVDADLMEEVIQEEKEQVANMLRLMERGGGAPAYDGDEGDEG